MQDLTLKLEQIRQKRENKRKDYNIFQYEKLEDIISATKVRTQGTWFHADSSLCAHLICDWKLAWLSVSSWLDAGYGDKLGKVVGAHKITDAHLDRVTELGNGSF